jgi:pimeloyl-ACP methyl ester carboxylesterase
VFALKTKARGRSDTPASLPFRTIQLAILVFTRPTDECFCYLGIVISVRIKEMKTVLFVPGYQEAIRSRDYPSVIEAIEKQGYKVKFIAIKWSRTTIDDWTKELDAIYDEYNPQQTILAGFSYGAMISFVSALKRNPSELWLFSLSPYFAEDLKSKNMKPSWLKNIGHRRVTAFNNLNFQNLSKEIKCKTLLFVGRLEIDGWLVIDERSTAAHKYLKRSELIVIENVGHDVADRHYISEIANHI